MSFYKFELRVNKNTINMHFGLKIREMILYKQKLQIICKSKARRKGKRKYMKIPLPPPFFTFILPNLTGTAIENAFENKT